MCIINLCLFRKIKLMELIYYSTTNFLTIGEYFLFHFVGLKIG